MITQYTHQGKCIECTLEKKEDYYLYSDGEKEFMAKIDPISSHEYLLTVNGRTYRTCAVMDNDHIFIHLQGNQYCFKLDDKDSATSSSGKDSDQESGRITAPMPGRILRINVSIGDEIKEGQCLAIVEAMKMETDLNAQSDGVVKAVLKNENDQVDAGELILEIEVHTE